MGVAWGGAVQTLNQCLDKVRWMKVNKMKFNPDNKTKVPLVGANLALGGLSHNTLSWQSCLQHGTQVGHWGGGGGWEKP